MSPFKEFIAETTRLAALCGGTLDEIFDSDKLVEGWFQQHPDELERLIEPPPRAPRTSAKRGKPATFRQSDIMRTIDTVKAAGVKIATVEVHLADGVTLRIGGEHGAAPAAPSEADLDRELIEWKARRNGQR